MISNPLEGPDPSVLYEEFSEDAPLGTSLGSLRVEVKDYLKNNMKVESKATELCSMYGTSPALAGVLKPGNLLTLSLSYQHGIHINILCGGWIELISGIPHCHSYNPQKDLAMG